jgi:hypothetical protein
MIDIKKLLKKKTWKGEELGKALIHTLADDVMKVLEPSHVRSITVDDINRMKSGILYEPEGRIYNRFRNLYEAILTLFNRNQGMTQQAAHGFYRLKGYLKSSQVAETFSFLHARTTPVIMTPKQYEDCIAQKEAELKKQKESYVELIYTAIHFYVEQYSEGKTVPKAIKAALDSLKNQPVKNKRVLMEYNRINGIGYYELPDGRRSDQMTPERWKVVLQREFEKGNIIVNGKDSAAPAFQYLNIDGAERILEQKDNDMILEFRGVSVYDAEEYNYITAEWYISDKIPSNLTLWDILNKNTAAYAYSLNGDAQDTIEVQEFFKDYSELCEAVKAELCKISPLKEKITKVKSSQYLKPMVTWGDLASWNVLDYTGKITVDEIALSVEREDDRIFFAGLAIIKYKGASKIDNGGNFEERDFAYIGMKILEEAEDDIIYARESVFFPAMKCCYAFRVFIETVGEVYGVKEDMAILALVNSLEDSMRQIDTLNEMALELYKRVGDDQTKKNTIKKLFPWLEADELKPTENAIEALRTMLSGDEDVFHTQDAQIAIETLLER